MVHRVYRSPYWLAIVNMAILAALGCSGHRAPAEFIPAPATARQALTAALDAWKAGLPVGRIDTATPPINVADAHRRKGQKLVSYEVLGEVPGEGPRWFAVRLILENPTEELRVRYGVIGIDPIWVWRKEDYEMVTHWGHHMEENAGPEKTPSP